MIETAFVLGENGFQKCFSVNAGVWLRMENTFFGNAFQFDRVLGVKSFLFLFYLQISFSGKHREREREREPIAGDHEPSTSPATQSLRATNPRTNFRLRRRTQSPDHPWTQSLWPTNLRLRRRLRAFDFAGNPRTDLSLSVRFWFLCEFDFFCCRGGVGGGVLVVFVVVGFVLVVVENSIFRMLPNTWKYFLEQFL